MSRIQFKDYTRQVSALFPARLDKNILDNAPARFLDRIIDDLDLSDLIGTYESGDTSPYHPRMLVKVVFYAYMNNVYSCRKIEKLLHENIHYMWLSGNQHPSYSTINRFLVNA